MKKIIFENDYILFLYKKHIDGMSIKAISKELKITCSVIYRVFKENNLEIIKRKYLYRNKRGTKISQEKIDLMIELYLADKSLNDIKDILHINISQIKRMLNNNNIKTNKTTFDFRHKNRKYTINETYFNNIDTPEKAYILGFLYADGNAHGKHSHITLKLQERDRLILEIISLLINSNKPLHFNKKIKETHQNMYSLKITNKLIYLDLLRHGIVPNKTFITTYPILDKNLNSHFIRGYSDGDGSLYICHKNKSACWSIIGSSLFCKQIADIIKNELNINTYICHDKRAKKGIDILRIRKLADFKNICNWLYYNSTIHLDRKYQKFIEFNKMREEIK